MRVTVDDIHTPCPTHLASMMSDGDRQKYIRFASRIACAFACCAMLLACGNSKTNDSASTNGSDGKAPHAVRAQAKKVVKSVAKKPALPAGPIAKGEGYVLEAKVPDAYKAGTDDHIDVLLTTSGIFHVNKDYPIRIEPAAPKGVRFAKKTFAKEDAQNFGDTEALFRLPVKAEAGEHQIRLHVSFAVCTKENCMPDDKDLLVTLKAGA